jgi:hypothetical protein
VERAAALAAYLQALCRHLLLREEDAPSEDDYLVYNYNRFQACRFGLDGSITNPKTYQTLSLREDILATLRLMEPHADALGSYDALRGLSDVVRATNDATYLRGQYEAQGSAEGMVNAAIERFRSAAPSGRAPGHVSSVAYTFTNHFLRHMNHATQNMLALNSSACNSEALTGAIGSAAIGAYNILPSASVLPSAWSNLMKPSILAVKPEKAKMNSAFIP